MHPMSRHQDEALSPSLYTLPAVVLLAAVALAFVGVGFVMPLRALYARDLGASSVEVGLMATAFLLASVVVTPAMGWLADRIGPRTVLGLSLLTYAGLLASYVPITSPSTLLVLRALEGVSAAGVLTPARALMNTVAPPARYGEALSLVSTARYVGIVAGPAVGTLLASSVGYTPAFLAASAVARAATDGFLADHVPQGLQGRIHALFSAAGTTGSLAGAMASGFLYAVEPGMPLLAMGVLYLLVAVVLLGGPCLASRASSQ